VYQALRAGSDEEAAPPIRLRIFEIVQRRTMILKEEQHSYEGFPGLSRTTQLATFWEARWSPRVIKGERVWRRMLGLIALTHFQVR